MQKCNNNIIHIAYLKALYNNNNLFYNIPHNYIIINDKI